MKISQRQLQQFTFFLQLLLLLLSTVVSAVIISIYLPGLDIPKTSAFFSSQVISYWTDFFLPGVFFVFKLFLIYLIINLLFLFLIQKTGKRWNISIPIGIGISAISHNLVFWTGLFWVRMLLFCDAAAFRNADLFMCFEFQPLDTPELVMGIFLSILIIGTYWTLWKRYRQSIIGLSMR
jgi:hypothetical protein